MQQGTVMYVWNRCVVGGRPRPPTVLPSSHKTTGYSGNDKPFKVPGLFITLQAGLLSPLTQVLDSLIKDQPHLINEYWLNSAKTLIDCKGLLEPPAVRSEEETADWFVSAVAEPLQYLARAFGIHALTLESAEPKNDVKPDRVFKVNRIPVLVVEFKNPTCGGKHFGVLNEKGGEGIKLNLQEKNTSSTSILAKLAGYCTWAKVKWGLLVDMREFLLIRFDGTDEDEENSQFQMSQLLPIDSVDTPIMSVILQIIRESQVPGANAVFRRQGGGTPTTDESNEDRRDEDRRDEDRRDEDRREDHGMDGESGDDTTPSSSTTGSRTPTAYWIPRDMGPTSLAAVLEKRESVSVRWRVPRYTEAIWLTARWPNATVWNAALPSTDLSTSIHQADPFSPSPSPPSVPFEIHLDREIINNVFDAHMPGVDVRLIAKFTPTVQAERELAAWRKLRHLAGTKIPGLFGVYSIEGCKTGPHAFIIQQYAGRSPRSYVTLNRKQRQELYQTIRNMHRSGIKHGDIAPRNVALNDKGRLMVLDFGRSNSHDCPGESCCEELVDLKFALDLGQNDSLKSLPARAPTIKEAKQRDTRTTIDNTPPGGRAALVYHHQQGAQYS